MLELRRDDRLDTLDIVVEPKPERASDADGLRQAAALLAQNVKAYVGVTAGVRIAEIGQVARSIGKAKRVIDLRPKD